MLRWIFAIVLFFLVVVELVFFAPGAGDREVKGPAISQEDRQNAEDSEQVLAGGYLVESQGEAKAWELWSEVAKKKKGIEEWELDTVKVRFYGKSKVVYIAKGKKGYVTDSQSKLRIEGDVTVTSSNGYVLETSKIDYDAVSRSLVGPEPVDLKSPEAKGEAGPLYLRGQRFDADLNTNKIRLLGGVKGRKRMSGGRRMNIASRTAHFSGLNNMARFEKNVVIRVNKMRIRGPRAHFVYRNGELDTLSMTGGVQMNDLDKVGSAGQADVFFKEDKYVFQGEPKVTQGEDQLIGTLITLFDAGERIQVVKARAKYVPKNQD